MNYQQTMQYINHFSHSGEPVKNLDRIAGLLKALGNPQKNLKFVHIAGTNGKGSVAEYLYNIFINAGYRTGCFTSPYIRHYRDRIRLNAQDIPEEILCELCEKVAAVAGEKPYSQFEITLAIAFLYFLQMQAEIVILETGIGGLVDATNSIENPLVSVLTSISKDHMEILGNSIEEIARQKAGIIKQGCPVVSSLKNKGNVIFQLTADIKGCPFYTPDTDAYEIESISLTEGNDFSYHLQKYHTKMSGMHQVDNALTVLETVNVLKKHFDIPEEAVKKALAETIVPARIQVLQTNPLVVLDGGHNADGIGALTDLLSESDIKNWIGICGMTNSKDADTAAFQLALLLSKVLCVDSFSANSLSRIELCQAFIRQHAMALETELTAALPYAVKWAKGSHGGVVICGSLYLASWYLNHLQTEG